MDRMFLNYIYQEDKKGTLFPDPAPTPTVGETDKLAGHTWEDLQQYRGYYEA